MELQRLIVKARNLGYSIEDQHHSPAVLYNGKVVYELTTDTEGLIEYLGGLHG